MSSVLHGARRYLPLALLAVAAGCYNYAAHAPSAPAEVGRTFRVQLTDSGTVVLASQVGPGVYQLDGRVAASDERAITLAVTSLLSRRSAAEQYWNGETIVIPRPVIETMHQRELSRGRTAAFVAGILGGVLALYAMFEAIGGGNTGGGSSGGDTR